MSNDSSSAVCVAFPFETYLLILFLDMFTLLALTQTVDNFIHSLIGCVDSIYLDYTRVSTLCVTCGRSVFDSQLHKINVSFINTTYQIRNVLINIRL